ncbi:hypothetical protein [Halobaculum saliterrae]|uniref:hypothetical protein n=1 Tax=Halobaculum saliterrae TaxID=2073113 RepID=UPI001F47CCAF|nr:hypothetical protein [Halobaculum saliterrae]
MIVEPVPRLGLVQKRLHRVGVHRLVDAWLFDRERVSAVTVNRLGSMNDCRTAAVDTGFDVERVELDRHASRRVEPVQVGDPVPAEVNPHYADTEARQFLTLTERHSIAWSTPSLVRR